MLFTFPGFSQEEVAKVKVPVCSNSKKKKKKIHDSTSVTLQKREKILRDLLHQKSNKY